MTCLDRGVLICVWLSFGSVQNKTCMHIIFYHALGTLTSMCDTPGCMEFVDIALTCWLALCMHLWMLHLVLFLFGISEDDNIMYNCARELNP
mmetsp:Transcript_19038/g.45725  ORF Transcript_19038/g.45725 Transcript_19038/m.45725 type:complete len:92 (-) Transcript_19038:20-295(-)